MGATSECELTLETYKYIPEIAMEIHKQMSIMAENNHLFADIVELETLDNIIGFLQDLPGLEVYVDPQDKHLVGAIGYSLAPLWWARPGKSKVLVEQLVLSAKGSVGFGRVAIKHLEEVARVNGCSLLMSGNLLGTQGQQTENLYVKKAGYTKVYSNYFKVVERSRC